MSHLRDALAEDIALMLTCGDGGMSNIARDRTLRNSKLYLTNVKPRGLAIPIGGGCFLTNEVCRSAREIDVQYMRCERIEIDNSGRPQSIKNIAEQILHETFGAWQKNKDLEAEVWKLAADLEDQKKEGEQTVSKWALYHQLMMKYAQEDARVFWIISFILGLAAGVIR